MSRALEVTEMDSVQQAVPARRQTDAPPESTTTPAPVPQGVPTSRLSNEEICRLGQEIYERDLKDVLEPTHNGEIVVINVVNGDSFVDPDEHRALDAAEGRYPDEVFYIGRVGYDYVDRIGSARAP
jgi:hypothetical protein